MNQVKAGVILNFAIIGLNTLTGLLYTPYMMRCLGQNEYGLYSLVASIIAYITILDAGFGNAVIRYASHLRVNGTPQQQFELFGMGFLINCILSIIGVIIGLILYINVDSMFDNTMSESDLCQARVMMALLVLNLAFSFPLGTFTSIITAYEDFIFQKTINLIRIILCTATIIMLLYHGYKAIAMIVIQTIFNLLTLAINFIYCRYKLKIRLSFSNLKWNQFRDVSIYSFWMFISVLIDRMYWSTGQFILGIVSGTFAVAIFSAAIILFQMYNSLSGAVSNVLLPKISKLVAANSDDKTISDLFILSGRLQAIILFTVLSGFIIFGRGFITIWAGAGYEQSFYVALIIFVALFTPLIQNTGIVILQARNQMKFRVLTYLFVASVSIVGQYYLGKIWGPVGCAIAIGVAIFIGPGIIINFYYNIKQRINTRKFWHEIYAMSQIPIIATILGLVTVHWIDYTKPVNLIIGITIYLTLYIPLFWKFSLNSYERNLFSTMYRNLFSRISI